MRAMRDVGVAAAAGAIGRRSAALGVGLAMCALAGACAGAAPADTKVTTESSSGSVPDAGPLPTPASSAASPSASAPASASPPASVGPLPTGGSVLIGDIVAPPSFDPKPAIVSAKEELVACYNKARQTTPSLRGKLMLRINVSETGKVMLVDAASGGTANDPVLVACLSEALRAVTFPKPNGLATISAPFVFRP
jgi:hypothetical protein